MSSPLCAQLVEAWSPGSSRQKLHDSICLLATRQESGWNERLHAAQHKSLCRWIPGEAGKHGKNAVLACAQLPKWKLLTQELHPAGNSDQSLRKLAVKENL